MPVAASEIFEFLECQEHGTVERHEIASSVFGNLRRSLRKIALSLRDSDDQEALLTSNRLQTLLSEWLTVPIPFDHSILTAVEDSLGPTEAVQARWGSDIRVLYDTAHCAAEELLLIENPVREKLAAVIRKFRSQGPTFKIYCHRRARCYFDSLLILPEDSSLSEEKFLHSIRDYRRCKPFEILIKVGPLRSRGWGSAPDALLTAPRFNTLFQIVWSGCSDDQDFGYDPVSPPTPVPMNDGDATSAAERMRRGPMVWTLQINRSGEDLGIPAGYNAEADELQVFREKNQPVRKRNVMLVQVDEEYGILYPPYSQVLSFDPAPGAHEPINQRTPGETLVEGMFLIKPIIGDVDFGGMHAEHGHYSRIWRAKLEQEWRTDATGLIARLNDAGLKLVHLNSAIRHWCKPPGTVIHGPQQMKHFEILMRVLDFDSSGKDGKGQKRLPLFWQLSWNEVRRSRGEAIQTGVQGHEIIEEQVLVLLRKLISQIREKAMADAGFSLAIPSGDDMKGGFLFYKVCGIEEGFWAPETELKEIRELNLIDQWRE